MSEIETTTNQNYLVSPESAISQKEKEKRRKKTHLHAK
jgi:hypothetical protein